MFAREFAAAKMVCIPEHILEDGEWGILEWRDRRAYAAPASFRSSTANSPTQRGCWDKPSFDGISDRAAG
jgi:hypothetical protein